MLTRLLVTAAQLLGNKGLVLAKQLRVEANVTRCVDAVHVTVKLSASRCTNMGSRIAYPNPAAIEKYFETGRKACSLSSGQYLCPVSIWGSNQTHICQMSSGLLHVLVAVPFPQTLFVTHWV